MGFRLQKPFIPTSQFVQNVLEQAEMMYTKMQYKPTSNTKPVMDKKRMLLNSKIVKKSMCFNLKQIIRAVKFCSQISTELGFISLKSGIKLQLLGTKDWKG